MTDQDRVAWTAKLPLLIAGILFIVAGVLEVAVGRGRMWLIIGLATIILGSAFIGYSIAIKDWCVYRPGMAISAFSGSFAADFNACARTKGWLEL
jgi:hypothetical protein